MDRVLWEALLSERDPRRRAVAAQQLATGIASEDVRELLELSAAPSEVQREAAVGVLLAVARRQPAPLTAGDRDAWRKVLLSNIWRECPDTRTGRVSFTALRENWPGDAARFLFSYQTPEVMSEDALGWLLTSLRYDGSPRAIAMLRELAARAGRIGQEADSTLEALGVVPWEKVLKLAKEWREKPSADRLNKLCHAYIDHLAPGQVSEQELVELFGEPTFKDQSGVAYRKGNAQLTLHFDSSRRLKSWKLN